MSTPDQQAPPLATALERRFYTRFVPQAPIFFRFNENEAKVSGLLNVSENGLLISTQASLPCNFVTRILIPLRGLPRPLRVTARVAWTNDTGSLAGIQLLDLSERDREQIRKWGMHQSLVPPSPQPQSAHRALDAPSFTSSSEIPDFIPAFGKASPLNSPSDISMLAFPPPVRRRATSNTDRRAIRLLLIGMASLIAAVVVIMAAPRNPFARSKEITPESTAAPPPGEMQPELQTPYTSDSVSSTQARSLTPSGDTATSKHAPVAGLPPLRNFAKRLEGPEKATSDENPANTQGDLSVATTVPVPNVAASGSASASPQSSALAGDPTKATSEAETPLSPDPASPKQPVPSGAAATDITAAVPSNAPSNTPVAPTSSNPSPVGSLTEAGPPQNRTLEVHLPSGRSGSLSLPGQRLLESPSLTMNIQRSVLMPPTHAIWPLRRNRKVLVGELISHIDPQFAQPPSSAAVSLCVKATITKDGRVENIKQILGPPNLAPAVIKALQEWRYQPTLIDGKPVETQCYVTFQFRSMAYHAAKR